MINKQNLWFLTLFSLVLVLGVYYVTMPNEMLLKNVKTSDKTAKGTKTTNVKTSSKEISSLDAMRVSLEEERNEEMTSLQEQLTSGKMGAEEKNNAYEQLKYLNSLQGKEEKLEKKLKDNLKLDCFVKINTTAIESVCISSKHDKSLANNIMRSLQEEYTDKMNITVKFQKK
ncbi:MAG: SpoIIIAH-like family protein [Bacilli bacterium]|nr:SpoIIIAH-like family protein [Bacilli bacterium]